MTMTNDAIDELLAQERSLGSADAVFALDDNPDDAARAIQLGQATGTDPSLIYPEVKAWETQQRGQVTKGLFDQNAYLREYAAANPIAAKVSNDDWGQLDSASEMIRKLPTTVFPGVSLEGVEAVGKAGLKGFVEAFKYGEQEEEFKKFGEYLAANPVFGNLVIRHVTQAAGGALSVGMHAIGAAAAGVATATGAAVQRAGVSETWANRLVRDVYAGLQVAIPEARLIPELAARRAAQKSFDDTIRPYLDQDKAPPPGIHPEVDALHAEQAQVDLKNLQDALKGATESNTRERNPDLFAGFVRQITDGDIGVSADAVRALYGDKVPDPADGLLGWVPRLQEQLRAAEATGGDIQVPIADWLARVDPAVAKQLEEFVRVRPEGMTVAEAKVGVEGWHGSPHEFEAFSSEKIGSGEGAQSYGHGHYVAENPSVAEEYQKNVAPKTNGPEFIAQNALNKFGGDRVQAAADLRTVQLPGYQEAANLLDKGWTKSDGSLYKVRIKRSPEEFLDWDKPLGEQGEIGQRAINALAEREYKEAIALAEKDENPMLLEVIKENGLEGMKERLRGEDIAASRPQAPEVARALSEAGIPGIKYLDQGSRLGTQDIETMKGGYERTLARLNAHERGVFQSDVDTAKERYESALARHGAEPTRNYVVFSEADLEIISRNGEALKAAREAAGLRPLTAAPEQVAAEAAKIGSELPLDQREAFAKASALGMTVEQYGRYQKKIAEQIAGDQEAILKTTMAAEKRRASMDWKEKSEALRSEVVDDFRADPAFAADRLVREGRFGTVDLGAVKIAEADLTPEQRAILPKSYVAKRGQPVSELAEIVGARDGQAFIADLVAFHEARKVSGMSPDTFTRRLVDAEIERRMEETHGRLEDNVLEAVKERVLAETQVELLHEETLAAAMRAGLEFSITKEGMEAAIRGDFDQLVLKEISSDKFLAEAGRQGRAAEIALLKGDFAEAFRLKQRQYSAFIQARFAKALADEMAALNKTAKPYQARDVKKVDPATRFYIQGLLQEGGYNVRMLPDEIAREIQAYGHGTLGDFTLNKASYGWEPEVADWLRASGAKEVKTMTPPEFADFKAAIDTLNHIGHEEMKIDLRGTKKDFKVFRAEVLKNLKLRPIRDADEAARGGNWLYRIDAPWTRMEEMAKDIDFRKELGPLYNALIVPYELSKAKSFEMTEKLSKDLKKIGGFDKKWRESLEHDIPNDFIFDTYNETLFKMNRWNMMKMMLNWGNESNAAKLVDGITRAGLEGSQIKITPEMRKVTQQKIEKMFLDHSRKEDWDFVQHMWDLFGGYQKETATIQRNLGGKPPKWIEGRGVVTPHGTYTGGYFPLIRDPLRRFNHMGDSKHAPKVNGPLGEDYFRATTNQNHLIDRTGATYFVDITNGPEQLVGRLAQVIHDISYRDFAVNAGKVIYDGEMMAAIKKYYGVEYAAQMEPWLKRIVGQANVPEAALQGWNNVLRQTRLNLTLAALPLNYKVMLSPSMGTANIKQFVQFNANRTANKKLVMENSKELQHMLYTIDRDLNESLNKALSKGTYTSFQRTTAEKMFKPLIWMEQQLRMATFYGEFMAQKAKGRGDFEASTLADSLVRERHSTAAIGDLPALMASPNEFVKMSTVFMGFFTGQRNWQRQIPHMMREGDYSGVGKILWSTVVVTAAMNAALFTQRKENDTFFSFMSRAVASVPLAMVPFARDIWSFYSEGYRSSSPIVGMGIAVGDLIKDGVKGIKGEAVKRPIKHAFGVLGQAAGIPGSLQIGRTGQFLADVAQRKQVPRDMTEWMRGILSGESKLRK